MYSFKAKCKTVASIKDTSSYFCLKHYQLVVKNIIDRKFMSINRLPDKNMWLFGLMLNKVGHLHVTIS